ncbi:14978_t:CDS:2 [Gigaspora rosea]|nr:14978_t:CDS:2 [Gigaspora rosea]
MGGFTTPSLSSPIKHSSIEEKKGNPRKHSSIEEEGSPIKHLSEEEEAIIINNIPNELSFEIKILQIIYTDKGLFVESNVQEILSLSSVLLLAEIPIPEQCCND